MNKKPTKKKKGYVLEIGYTPDRLPTSFCLNSTAAGGADYVTPIDQVPYEIESGECLSIISRYTVTKIRPDKFVDVMNEWHRILKPKGRLVIIAAYGNHPLFIQDPENVKPVNEMTWAYFAPLHESKFWFKYRPKPWAIIVNVWNDNGTMEVLLEKIDESDLLIDEKAKKVQVLPS